MKTFILIFFGTIAGVWSGPLGVTFGRDQCVLRGESVVIACAYDYPLGHIVTGVSWAKSQQRSGNGELVPLLTSQYSGRFRYVGNYRGNCNLQISDVQLADEGSYVFGFRTTLAWLTTSRTPAQLFVRELAAVGPSSVVEGDAVSLACVSGCGPPVESVWFRQGEPVMKAAFPARRTDAGRYHCAVRGQPTVRSAPVTLTVLYPPDRVSLSISPGGNVLRGTSVVFTCSGEANPPVEDRGFSLHRDGRLLGFGRSQTIPEVQPDHSGRYRCQAWNSISRAGVDTFTSAVVLLQVYYPPENVSVWVEPASPEAGSSVNLSCSGAANPPAENYTWFRMTEAGGSGGLEVGSGQVLHIPSMEASLSGLYLCQARNQVGERNSTEVLLAMVEKEQQGSLTLPVLAGLGLALMAAFVLALFVFWRNKKRLAQEKEAEQGFGGTQAHDESTGIYANIYRPSSPPPDITLHSPQPRCSEQHSRSSMESEVTYSSVNITSRGLSDSAQVQASRCNSENNAVIYASVKTG